jgi:hypothetical protein
MFSIDRTDSVRKDAADQVRKGSGSIFTQFVPQDSRMESIQTKPSQAPTTHEQMARASGTWVP